MKNAYSFLLLVSLLVACGRSDNTNTSTTAADSVATQQASTKQCQSVVEAAKLDKADVYEESAKPIKVSLTLAQDTTTIGADNNCYFNNTITILVTKKQGSQLFKRTLVKEDIAYFTKTDDEIGRSVLQSVTYKPTFNGQKYFTLTMQLIDPVSRKTLTHTVFMNYFGEIVKAK